MKAIGFPGSALCLAVLLTGPPRIAGAADISMPADARSWILLTSPDCENTASGRGHCAGDVSALIDTGNLSLLGNYPVYCTARLDANGMHGDVLSSPAEVEMSMIDTYTLHSSTVPDGTVVPVTAVLHMTGLLTRGPSGPFWGGGNISTHIGNSWNPAPILSTESTRVPAASGTVQSQFVFTSTVPTAPVPLDIQSTYSFDAVVGTPFNVGYYLEATASASEIDFSHSASIQIQVPDGIMVTSTGGYGAPVPVQPETWGRLKSRYR